jgi:hypothetical protein
MDYGEAAANKAIETGVTTVETSLLEGPGKILTVRFVLILQRISTSRLVKIVPD